MHNLVKVETFFNEENNSLQRFNNSHNSGNVGLTTHLTRRPESTVYCTGISVSFVNGNVMSRYDGTIADPHRFSLVCEIMASKFRPKNAQNDGTVHAV